MASRIVMSSLMVGILMSIFFSCNNSSILRAEAATSACDGEREAEDISSSCASQVEMRPFNRHGCDTHVFVEFGAYRVGNSTFSILGLASKSLHSFGNPSFSCEWIGATSGKSVEGKANKHLPDYGLGKIYSVVVITCFFESDVGTDSQGGELILHAYHGMGSLVDEERIVALREKAGEYDLIASKFQGPYEYDFVYCGCPLYGKLSPSRISEWITYHDLFMGERSHFILYDAGGIQGPVRAVLEPWIKRGKVSIHDIRLTQHFDGFGHNQFLIVNDCVQRTKFMTNWTILFDVDEYLYLEPPNTLHSLMEERYSKGTIETRFRQYRMLPECCHLDSTGWGIERMQYRNLPDSDLTTTKYVCNPRLIYATGLHGVQSVHSVDNYESQEVMEREFLNLTIGRYYHYHGSVNVDQEAHTCSILSNSTNSSLDIVPSACLTGYDASMAPLAPAAKRHMKQMNLTSLLGDSGM